MKTNDKQFEDHATLVDTEDDIEIIVQVESAALEWYMTRHIDREEYEVLDAEWIAYSTEGEDLSADLDAADRQRINWAAEQFVIDTPGLDW